MENKIQELTDKIFREGVEKGNEEAQRIVEKANAEAAAKTLEGKSLRISAKAGANGRLFGSVTSKEIAEQIKKTFDIDIDKKKLVVEDIRSFGTFECTVKVYTGISAKIYIVVGE